MTILNKKDGRKALYADEVRWESDVVRLYEPGCRTWVHYDNEDDG